MRLLNLCCGAVRNQSPEWTNLDDLHSVLALGTEERRNLDGEKNYVNHRLGDGLMPFEDNVFDAICASHCIEHFSLLKSVEVLKDCLRVLKPGGQIVVSVPDAAIFRSHLHEDTVENAPAIYGEPIYPGEGSTFMEYAGFNRFHEQLFSMDSLWCVMTQAGIKFDNEYVIDTSPNPNPSLGFTEGTVLYKIAPLLNRLKFSLVMVGKKP